MSAKPAASVARFPGSIKQLERARKSLAGGVATAMRAAQLPTPLVIDHAEGSHLFDIDGNEYIDYVLGFGPMLLGHSPRPVLDAIHDQLERGLTFGAQHVLEAEVAERIVESVPCAELVCFSSTGSEAVHAALRLARAATGRRKIVKFQGHYHGWLDPVHTAAPGLPVAPFDRPHPDLLVCDWNNVEALAALLASDDVAAVIMEPVASNSGVISPLPGYLEDVRELTRERGVLLIFDEVVTGFRVALGGAQERFGVTPDLATFGKAIAAGLPLSAVAGRRDVMEAVADGRVRHVGTFNASPPAAAAAKAALDIYRAQAPRLFDELERTAVSLADGLANVAASAGVPLRVHQVGPLLQTLILEGGEPVTTYEDTLRADGKRLARFSEKMLQLGVMVLPRGWWFISTEHTDADIAATLEAATTSFVGLAAGNTTEGDTQ